jgi:hypothetical protein
MPLLGGLFIGLFTGLAEFFAKYLTKKLSLIAAAMATFLALTIGFWSAVTAALVGLSYSFPGGSAVAIGVWLMIPDNAPACVSACLAVDTAVGLYRWNIANLKFASYVT